MKSLALVASMLLCACADPVFLDVVTAPVAAVLALHSCGDAQKSYHPTPSPSPRHSYYHHELNWLGLTPPGLWPAWPVDETLPV